MSGIGAARAWAAARRDGITARFPSICRKCPEPINPGDRIAPVMGGGFAHMDCLRTDDES